MRLFVIHARLSHNCKARRLIVLFLRFMVPMISGVVSLFELEKSSKTTLVIPDNHLNLFVS